MSYYTPARAVQWVPRINKKLNAPLHTKEHFWDDAYTQILSKVYLLMEVLKVPIILYRSKLRPLNSNLKACIAPHMALESTLGPSSTTQRSLNSTRRVCIAPHVALENTLGPHTTTQRPLKESLCPVQPLMWHWRLPKDPITPPRE